MKKCKVCGVVVETTKSEDTKYGLHPPVEWVYCEKCESLKNKEVKIYENK